MTTENIKIRIPFNGLAAIGPGKADLLEAIHAKGSISAAGRHMGMSYKRAWDLVDIMNRSFKNPLVATAKGGVQGGGAQVTEFGFEVLRRYRAMEAKAEQAISEDIGDLMDMLSAQVD
jgi:molybdate transport system regulatory protein